MESLKQYREKEFEVHQEYVYMNHASLSPLPQRVKLAMQQFNQERADSGSVVVPEYKECMERTRAEWARLIGAKKEEVAFVKNTPEGISFVAAGLLWQQGDNVVTNSLEFPANMFPWLNLEQYGVSTRIVKASNGKVMPEVLFEAVDQKTRVIAISWVMFSNGYRTDLETISTFCREKKIHLVVDAIQGIGCIPLDLSKLGIDFLSAAAHKWMLGPYGVGCFYCNAAVLDQVKLVEVGHNTYERQESFLDYRQILKKDASRFEAGVANLEAFAGAEASLSLFHEVEVERIWRKVKGLTDYLVEKLLTSGYQVCSHRTDKEASGIVSFSSPKHASTELFKKLNESKIIVSLCENMIRVSPHFYNTTDEIEELIAELP